MLTKRVTIGIPDFPNVIQYDVTFGLPLDERHRYAQFEAVTGYMPPVFEDFFALNQSSGKAENVSDGPGEQSQLIIFANRKRSHAIGVYSPDQPSSGFEQSGYGRFRFIQEKVVKWNCVFRYKASEPLPMVDHEFRLFVVIGNLDQVVSTMNRLIAEFSAP